MRQHRTQADFQVFLNREAAVLDSSSDADTADRILNHLRIATEDLERSASDPRATSGSTEPLSCQRAIITAKRRQASPHHQE